MARKSIKGYSEKNYYDNTKFSGVTATYDILNEGSFRHMVNLDISDTGKSVTPRKGYLTTEFIDADGNPIVLTDSTIYFQEPSLGEYIFLDFTPTVSAEELQVSPVCFRTSFAVHKNKFVTTPVADINYEELMVYLSLVSEDSIRALKPVNSNFAEIIYDEYGIKQNVIKVSYLDKQFWINLVYNKDQNVLYLSPVHTEDPVGILSGDRNIASDKSIIPDPMCAIYEKDNAPIGHYNRIPMIYAVQNNKYLVETANTLNGLNLKPSFFVEDFADDDAYEWAYTYDIRSTSPLVSDTYTSPVYNLKEHYAYTDRNLFTVINDLMTDNGFSTNVETDTELRAEISHLSWTKDKWLISSHMQNKYVVYVVPGEDSIAGTFKLDKDTLDNVVVEPAVNEYNTLKLLFTNHNSNSLQSSITLDGLQARTTSAEVYTFFEDMNVRFFVVPLSELEDYAYTPTKNYLYNYYNTVLYSNVMFLPDNLLTLQEFKAKYLDKVNHLTTYYFKVFDAISKFTIDKDLFSASTWSNDVSLTNGLVVRDYLGTYFPLNESTNYMCTVGNNDMSEYIFTVMYEDPVYGNIPSTLSFPWPYLSEHYVSDYVNFNTTVSNRFDDSLFRSDYSLYYTLTNVVIKRLDDNFFFENGIDLTFYLLRYPKTIPDGMNYDIYERELLISSTTLFQSRMVTLDSNPPTYIPERITEEPEAIMSSKNTMVFRDTLGDHLVVWNNNQVFVSEPNTYYYFKYTGMFSYPAKVIKVIQYKDTLLVFTVQDLYSIFPYESTVQVQDGTDDEGNPKYVQSKVITYNTLPVLYNLMVDEKYADAIQVFNQMVLFYSADGQMFMIKPTATIDSNTRFSVQYFNKSANDILANYDVYINERLKVYDIKKNITKDDVVIKVSVNINYIKIFYCVPDVITYILIYDVVNNYYYVYDTITYTHITNILFHEGYELYCTAHKDYTAHTERYYISLPYRDVYSNDNNVDISCYHNFYRNDINTELDTGNINLNNHIKKRFRNLHTVYKNINAHELLYTVESFVDDTPVLVLAQNTLEVKDVNGVLSYTQVENENKVNLLKENTALFDFSSYDMNKIITHKSNIICSGKSLRLRLRFASKGKYKILSYGLIYKEHHV